MTTRSSFSLISSVRLWLGVGATCLLCTQALAGPKKPAPPVVAAAPVSAAPSAPAGPVAHQGISHVLAFLNWGASASDVMAALKGEVDLRYSEKLREERDPLEIDRALRRKAAEFAAIEKTLVQFSGQRTGYESSLISTDFVADNEEAMIRIDDQEAQRYYFFKNDHLWKILVAYSSSISRSTPFPDFVKQVQDKYGRAASAEWTPAKGGAKTMTSSLWEDELTRLVVEDRTEFYGTYCMKFLDKAVGVPLEAERAKRSTARQMVQTDASVDAAMLEITGGPTGGDDNVVDRLTGTNHAIDLAGNRPEYETNLNRGTPAESPVYVRDSAPAKSKGKGKAKGKEAKPAAPAKPANDKPAQAPIIY